MDGVRRGGLRSRDIVESLLDRIRTVDPTLGAFLRVFPEEARAGADRVDACVADGGDPGPLAGMPVAVKDNICVALGPTTCGSRILETFIPPRDATVVTRLTGAGAVILGKTNLDEFGMGSSTENSAFGPTRNPWDRSRTPGGSSGGTAAAVAARLAPAGLGSDTGGSIRQPAAFCDLVGLKPTWGRVPRTGLAAFGSSLDQVGPLTRTVTDAALLFSVIAGRDPLDATSSAAPVPDTAAAAAAGAAGLRVGLPEEYLGEGIDPAIRAVVEAAAETLARSGARTGRASLPHTRFAVPAYYIVAPCEASSNLSRYDGVRFGRRAKDASDLRSLYAETRSLGLGAEPIRRILLGTFCLSAGWREAFYDKAQRVRTLIRRDFEAVFRDHDVLLCPVTPVPPFRLGERISDPLAMYLTDALTVACSLAGIPGMSVPAGFITVDGRRLPVGVQILAPAFREDLLFRAAGALERELGFATELPGDLPPGDPA